MAYGVEELKKPFLSRLCTKITGGIERKLTNNPVTNYISGRNEKNAFTYLDTKRRELAKEKPEDINSAVIDDILGLAPILNYSLDVAIYEADKGKLTFVDSGSTSESDSFRFSKGMDHSGLDQYPLYMNIHDCCQINNIYVFRMENTYLMIKTGKNKKFSLDLYKKIDGYLRKAFSSNNKKKK
ncbi:hypothetical protein KY358_03885 [Candidatus Woesearchaeota archaeon]|nr:hypothetical protein [Candidatus Woesearchaeota archaeon]